MNNIILLTDEFPLDNGEPFLETEIQFYEGFDHIYVIPLSYSKNKKIRSFKNLELVLIKNTKIELLLFSLLSLFKKDIYKEIKLLHSENMFSVNHFKHMILYYAKTAIFVYKIQKKVNINDIDVIYSYWMTNGAHISSKLKKRCNARIISRCHGYDLYENAYPGGYIPFRKDTLINIDSIYPISVEGKKYLLDKYIYLKKQKEKIHVSYLGSKKTKFREVQILNSINLMSCSNIIKVKRIDKIVNVLCLIKDININWYHIGDGDLKQEILDMSKRLPKNVKMNMIGQLSNNQVLEFYEQNDIHLFINTSASEGIPVSFMEAMSFGTPIIATNVGGVNEIVNNDCGMLVEKDFEYETIAKYIKRIRNMDNSEYQILRRNAYNAWERSFDSEKNYKNFIHELKKKERSSKK